MSDASDTTSDLEERMRLAGGRQLADVFMFPLLRSGHRQWCRYGTVSRVSWRDTEQDFYVRSARLPFDIVPLRPTDPARAGCWYSLGPGLTEGHELDSQLLLIQLEGRTANVNAESDAVRRTVLACMQVLEERTEVIEKRGDWVRYCASAIPVAA